jgi:hypothetical protein
MQINLSHAMRRKPRERERERERACLPGRPLVLNWARDYRGKQRPRVGWGLFDGDGRSTSLSRDSRRWSLAPCAASHPDLWLWLPGWQGPTARRQRCFCWRMLVVSCRLLQNNACPALGLCAAAPVGSGPNQRRNQKARQKAKPSEERQLTIAKKTQLF